MSLATLKKKTYAKYNNMSVSGPFRNKNGFSLVGGTRNYGFIGQTSLSRTLPKTIMKNDTAHGNGGCCGTFDQKGIVQSINCTNDSNVIKTPVLSTRGMLALRKCKRTYCATTNTTTETIKPDSTMNNNDQSDYILRKKEETINSANNGDCQKHTYEKGICNNDLKLVTSSNVECNITKDITEKNMETYDKYLEKLTQECLNKESMQQNNVKNNMDINLTC